jgi:hypothetical protein
MTFPLATPEGAAIEEVRARIRQARVDAAEAQRALAEKADDPTPEGAEAFKELLKARDEADKAVGILTDEWERLVGAGLNGKQYGLPFGRRDVLAPKVVQDALGADAKALESPSGAVLAPSYLAPGVFELPATPAAGLVWPLFRQQAVADLGVIEYLRQTAPTDQGAATPVAPLAAKPITTVSVGGGASRSRRSRR